MYKIGKYFIEISDLAKTASKRWNIQQKFGWENASSGVEGESRDNIEKRRTIEDFWIQGGMSPSVCAHGCSKCFFNIVLAFVKSYNFAITLKKFSVTIYQLLSNQAHKVGQKNIDYAASHALVCNNNHSGKIPQLNFQTN